MVGAILSQHRPGYLEIHRDHGRRRDPRARRDPRLGRQLPAPDVGPAQAARGGGATRSRACAARSGRSLIGGVELFRGRRGGRLPCGRGEARRRRSSPPCSPRACSRWITRCTWASTWGRSRLPAIQRRVRAADLVLALGTELTDMNLGAREAAGRARALDLGDRRARVTSRSTNTPTSSSTTSCAALAAQRLPRFREHVVYHDNLVAPRPGSAGRAPAPRERLAGRAERVSRGPPRLSRRGRVGRHALRRPRAAPARRPLPRAGLLRVDGLRRARPRSARRSARACARSCSRRRRLPDDRAPRSRTRRATG